MPYHVQVTMSAPVAADILQHQHIAHLKGRAHHAVQRCDPPRHILSPLGTGLESLDPGSGSGRHTPRRCHRVTGS